MFIRANKNENEIYGTKCKINYNYDYKYFIMRLYKDFNKKYWILVVKFTSDKG